MKIKICAVCAFRKISVDLIESKMKKYIIISVIFLFLDGFLERPLADVRKVCDDFSSYQDALKYYCKKKMEGGSGWRSLDRDGDNRPCECNPGKHKLDHWACDPEAPKAAASCSDLED